MQRSTWVGLALLSLGALRIGYAQALGLAEPAETQPLDARFAGLRIALRQVPFDQPLSLQPHLAASFAGDINVEIQRAVARASYALAPRVVLPLRDEPALTIFETTGADEDDSIILDAHMAELWRSDDGTLLLARRREP